VKPDLWVALARIPHVRFHARRGAGQARGGVLLAGGGAATAILRQGETLDAMVRRALDVHRAATPKRRPAPPLRGPTRPPTRATAPWPADWREALATLTRERDGARALLALKTARCEAERARGRRLTDLLGRYLALHCLPDAECALCEATRAALAAELPADD
jgi:hypothetical protein